jgi:hypothetical protein
MVRPLKLWNKKGQKLTLFFLLGMVILGAAAFYEFAQRAVIEEVDVDTPVSFAGFVDSCIETVLDDGLMKLSTGSIENVARVSVGSVDYALLDRALSNGEVAGQLENFISVGLPSCLSSDSTLTYSGDPKVGIIIQDRNVLVDVDYPISVVQDGQTQTLSEFSIDKSILLGEMLEHVATVFSEGIILQNFMDDIELVTQVLPTNQLLVLLVDSEYLVSGKSFYYGFVII